ncbi:MAG: D-2-hydroxyacid dehydrogenase [Actinomycetia bacterium]|nr:D-2-hydroxyacid dehydrogenase [Actinomycetes bacterium]
MPLQVLNQMGDRVAEMVAERFPEVEVVPVSPSAPPPGVRADVFFGGYGGWDTYLPWLEAAGVRWVQLSGTGADGVPAAVFDGRTITCARGASAGPISEFVLGAILAFAKRFPDIWLHEPPRHWNFPIPSMDVVEGRTVGIVGLGGIGVAIAQRASAFGMPVVALRRTNRPSPVAGVRVVQSLDELLAASDHIVLAAPATPRTKHLIDREAFAKMKSGAHLVNIARGSLVDQDALRDALDNGLVAMATLDTVDPEPLPAGHWMYAHPKVRLSAHVSWYTPEILGRTMELFVENLGRFIAGEPLHDVVDPVEGY